jgi:UDP-N-acetyl-D-galactosamine dehydrogenase
VADEQSKIAIAGLGYVGLPLAVALARKHPTVGFDISSRRVAELRSGVDSTAEVPGDELGSSSLEISDDPQALAGCSIFIVTVPTPIDQARRPDLEPLLKACELIGPWLSAGAIVVFESTVYPGVTEDVCGPALERSSGLRCGSDFTLGYSPERINPGDRAHPLEKVVKIVAGQDADTLDRLADLYGSVIEAGVHRASSIKVAEAAKVIENTQRDLNIALMNELSKICDLLGIRSADVLAAAGTKWNFLPFHPGLVGGHCIGVDPYYLTAKAEQLGYHPEVILAGRRVNDGMGAYVAQRVVKLLATGGGRGAPRVGILGLTFKENVPDVRNSKVIDIVEELRAFGIDPLVHDPRADAAQVRSLFGIELVDLDQLGDLSALIYAVPHREYREIEPEMGERIAAGGVLVDIRSRLDGRGIGPGITYWSL